jgi:hypothetical protein
MASTSTATSSFSSAHPALLQFVVGFLLLIAAAWFANISDETGDIAAGILAILWILFLMNHSNFLAGLAPKGA